VSAQYSSGGSHGSGDLSIYPPAPTTFDGISFRNFPEINSLASKLLPPPVHLEAKNFAGKDSRVGTEGWWRASQNKTANMYIIAIQL
jgi:hypothetical protein